jgi:hypothetical protein
MRTTSVRVHRRTTKQGKPTGVRQHTRRVEANPTDGIRAAVVTHGHINKSERYGTFVHRHPGGGIRHEHPSRQLLSYYPPSAIKPGIFLDENTPQEPEDD